MRFRGYGWCQRRRRERRTCEMVTLGTIQPSRRYRVTSRAAGVATDSCWRNSEFDQPALANMHWSPNYLSF
jgi:hypothetical protein